MTEFFYVICSFVVLIILLFSIDLKLTKTGKGIVIGFTFLICEIGQYLITFYNLLESILISFILLLASSYLLQSKLNHIIFIHKDQHQKRRHTEDETMPNDTSVYTNNQSEDFPLNVNHTKDYSDINNNKEGQSLIRKESLL